MLKGLANEVVLVTGAAGGIGRATCRRLAAEGARVVAADVDGAATAALVEDLGDEAVAVAADLSVPEGAARCVHAAVQRFGSLDRAFVNAGVAGAVGPVAEFDLSNYERVFAVNVRGAFLTAQAVVRHLHSGRRTGAILFTASIAGLRGNPHTAVYNASKHAVVGLARCLASEVGARGIRVNVLCPGVVDTQMMRGLEDGMGARLGLDAHGMRAAMESRSSLGRYAAAEEVAALAAWILSDEAPYCHGEIFTIGGGLMA